MNFKDVKKIVIPESAPQEREVVVANTSKSFSSSSTQSSFTYLNYYPTSGSNLGSNSKLRIKGTITSVSGTEYDEGGLYYRNSSGNLTSIGFSAGQTKSFDVVCYLTSEVSSTVWEVFTVKQYNMYGTNGNQMRVQLNKTNNNNLDIYVYNTFAQALFTLTITEVSEYQTVENPVVKITDSNGNILWQKSGAKVLESITLSGQTTSLNRGDAFSFGGTVTAHYSDSSTANVTSSTTFSGYNMATAGTYTVTASYTEDGVTKTATYQLTVVSGPAWHTIWSGSKTIKLSSRTITGAVTNFASTAAGTGNRPQIRITVTTTNNGSGTKKYALNGSSSYYTYYSSSIPNPYTVKLASSNNTHIISLVNEYSGYATYLRLMKDYNSTNDNVNFSLNSKGSPNYNYDGYVDITVTKIEQYY